MFGSTPLFGASTLPTFGTTNQNPFTQSSSPFGQPNQIPNKTGLFGSTNNFNFGQNNQPSGFLAAAPNNNNNNNSLFNQNTNFNLNPYMLGQPVRNGSVIKYSPVQETETMFKNGSSSLGHVRLNSITCMKEYENSSFEELRFDDYTSGNKNKPLQFAPANSMSTLCGTSNHSFASSCGNQNLSSVNNNNNKSSLFQKPIDTANIGFNKFTSNNMFSVPTTTNTFIAKTPTTSNNIFPKLPISTTTNNSLFGSTNTFFGNNSIKPFSLYPSEKPALPTKPFSFDIQPSKSDSNMKTFELKKETPNMFQNQTGFSWLNKPAQSNPPQTTTNINNLTVIPTLPQNVQPYIQNSELKLPRDIEEFRNVITLTSPYGMSDIFKDVEVQPLSNRPIDNSIKQAYSCQKSAEEVLQRIDRNNEPIISEPSRKVKEMYGLFKSLDEFEPKCELMPKYNIRKLCIKQAAASPPKPLVIEQVPVANKQMPVVNKQVPVVKKQVDVDCKKLPESSDSPSVLTLPKEDSNVNMQQVVDKNITSGIYNGDDSGVTVNNVIDVKENKDEKTDVISLAVKPNCGIKLTKPEYYTLPCLDDILKYVNADDACLVKGFTVGRVGFGNVYFPELIDVSDLDLDKIVDIGYRELTVYPDDEDKPPVGEGLNRRAQITLDKIFPRREDGDLETDVENLKARHYEDTLRLISVRMNVEFVEYRPETGSWVFIVQHF